MSAGDDMELGSYGYAEVVPNADLTLAQWARAEAFKGIMSGPAVDGHWSAVHIQEMINVYAELIVTGSIPEPPPGTCY